MPKEKVTLTLDADNLAQLRALVGRGSLSAAMDEALRQRLAHLTHQAAIDVWLAELDGTHGPVPDDVRAWGVDQVNDWAAKAYPQQQAG